MKQRIDVLEQENRRLSAANEVVKQDIGDVYECCPKVKKDIMNLEWELAKLKDEMRATRRKAELLAPPAADVAVPPAPKAADAARKPLSSSSPRNEARRCRNLRQ
jgi:hypothetical protein